MPRAWQSWTVAIVFAIAAAALCFPIWRDGQPVSLPDAAHEKLECASYTPSHNGHTLSPAEKRALVAIDLKILAARFRCVRTYSVSEGLDDVPRVARELGLRVLLGLWISSHAPSNDAELARGIQLANQYADVVDGVIVGNEVLLRREQTAAQLQALIDRVRAGTKAQVTYADVWEFWLRNPQLANSTHFVTVHILPYWEDHPIDIDRALDHVGSIYKKVQDAFPGRRILIGETGWPSVGRPRLNAVPGLINQARFVREFVAYAEHNQVPYNLIEAFDQPWKRVQEGTVGGYWGLYDSDGHSKFSFVGPVTSLTQSKLLLAFAAGLGALFALAAVSTAHRPIAVVAMFFAGCAAGAALVAQWIYLSTANRTLLDWIATGMWTLCGWITCVVSCMVLTRWMVGLHVPHPMPLARIVGRMGHGGGTEDGSRLLGAARFGVLLGAAYVSLGLVYEGRGRDFPLMLFALPALCVALLEFVTKPIDRRTVDNEEWLLAICIAVSSMYIAWNETAANVRAWTWCALGLLLAGTTIVSGWRNRAPMHPHERTEQQPHSA